MNHRPTLLGMVIRSQLSTYYYNFFPVVACQSPAPGPESCIHYSYPQQTNCLSFTNCSGAQCNITFPSGHATFVVHNCQDPVTVDLTVVTQNSNFQRMFDHSETVLPGYWDSVLVRMSRNTTHLLLHVREGQSCDSHVTNTKVLEIWSRIYYLSTKELAVLQAYMCVWQVIRYIYAVVTILQ